MNTEAILEKPQAIAGARIRQAQQDPAWVRWGLTLAVLAVVGVLVVIPVVNIFAEALSEGVGVYWKNLFADPDTRQSIILTLTVAPIALAANLLFGLAAAWAIARFDFPGRTLLTALIDLPFSVSPVVAGLMFVLIFGLQGYFGPFLRRDGYSVMPYAISILGTGLFVLLFFLFRPTNPQARPGLSDYPWLVGLVGSVAVFGLLFFVQQYFEVWPRNQSLKIIFATFWRVTVPNIKWGLVYGIILCNARAMGEFGAVYVVSGHIAGKTDTMPLRIEKLFQEYNLPGSFAVASLLTLLAILTLIAKTKLERKVPSTAKLPEPKTSETRA